jgi:putative hydrolase of the HAD superfamily
VVKRSHVEAVFLDFGGVICVPDHDAIRRALLPHRVAADGMALDRAHYVGMAAFDRAGGEEPQAGDEYLAAYVRAAGVLESSVAAAAEALRQAKAPWSHLLAGAGTGLRALAAMRLRLAVVSNSDGTLEARLRARGTCQVGSGPGVAVRAIIDSTAVGLHKPDPQIFAFALRATGARREATLHVGDSLHFDVHGAQAAGLGAVHVAPPGFCADRSHPHIATLAELPALLTSLS